MAGDTMFRVIELPTRADARGSLTVLDGELPFAIRRLYWIYESDGQLRGGHRHKVTRQALLAIKGEVVIHVDNGAERQDVRLDRPDRILIVEPEDWHRMTFGAGAILLVAASHSYDADDYIHEEYHRSA